MSDTREYFIRVNGQDIHIDRDVPSRPRLDGLWGGEQCEGCGTDIIESGSLTWFGGVPFERTAFVRCRECNAVYSVDSTDKEIQ